MIVLKRLVEPMMTASSLVKADGNIFWYDVSQSSVFKLEKVNGSDAYLPVSLYPNSKVPLVAAMTSFDPVGLEKGSLTFIYSRLLVIIAYPVYKDIVFEDNTLMESRVLFCVLSLTKVLTFSRQNMKSCA